VKRVGDVPVEVHATVARIPGAGPTETGLMYWLLTPRGSDD
jgi:hypothetical protein